MNAQVKPAADAAAATTAIVEFSKTEAALADLKQRYGGLVVDVSTKDGMQTAIKGRAELRGYRVNLEKTRQDLKADILARGRLIDGEAKRITVAIEELEEPLDLLIKSEETRKERERAEREAAEVARIAAIHKTIDDVRALAAAMVGKPSSAIAVAIEAARGVTIDAAEFQPTADDAKARTIATLEQLHAGAVAIEEARAAEERRIAEERAELARLRTEQEKRDREDQARIVEEAKARAAAREKAEADERAVREQREAEARAARARIEEEERAARAKRDEEDRAARLKREEDARAAEAERQRLAREQETRDAADREARKAREAEEAQLKAKREQLELEQREVERRAVEVLDARAMLAKFKERFGHVKEFAPVVKAINAVLKAPEPAPAAPGAAA